MEYIIKNRKPESVFRFFEDISRIPRGSYNEAGIADYLVRFAAERGLECHRDKTNNVFIKMPASKGMETRPAIVLQGHIDMVCEKNSDVDHDFLKDPLDLYLDGKFLRARGTTLGGDDGIAVAIMMALLDGEIKVHPAYECLFTASEEVGLDGAHAFDYSLLSGGRLINLDSEEQGIVTCGCAGGLRSDLSLHFTPIAFAGQCIRVQVKGLMGGHSGENINSGRANANKVMGRLLAKLLEKTDAHLVSLNGGSKDNAIPRECEAYLAVEDAAQADEIITAEAERIAAELLEGDRRGFSVICETAEAEASMLGSKETQNAVTLMACCTNGVMEMSKNVPGLVEFSRNLGVIVTEEGKIDFVFSTRSPIESQLDASVSELDLWAKAAGCTARHYSRYPGWKFAEKSALRDAYFAAYKAVTGEDATVNVIHAGLECGVFSSHLPDMDMISIGPNLHDVHSPDESMDLDSAEVFFAVLEKLIPEL